MNPAANECAVAIFARAPVPGRAKTRLIPRLGAEGAASLHERLAEHALATAVEAATGPVNLWCAPSRKHPFFAACAKTFAIGLEDQNAGDLGARMDAAFQRRGGRPLLLIGSDCPSITALHLRACAAALAGGADAVFLPAEDGGYGLVGLNRPVPEIFREVRWGADDVMAETRRRLRGLGLIWSEPAVIWDVDRPEDIERLAASGLLAGQEPPPDA